MTWFGRLLGLIVAFSGFAAAHVLVQAGDAQVPPLPTVSVTVPTLPVPPPSTPAPTVPVPSVPAPTVPVPPTPAPTVPVPVPTQPPVRLQPAPPAPPTSTATAPRPAPSTTATTTTAAPRPPSSATAPAPTPSRGSSAPFTFTTSAAESGSAGAATGEAARPTVRSRAFEARAHRTPRRVSVRLAFVLPKADRIFLIVRGPAPSCEIAGYIPVRGRKGTNRVYFAGRVHGRRLDPGVYLISLSPNRRLVPGAPTEYVRVVSKRRAQPLPDSARKPSCRAATTLAAATTDGIAVAEAAPSPPSPAARPGPARPAAQVSGDEEDEGAAGLVPEAGVLGAATGESDEEPFVAVAVLSLVAALLIAMVVLVGRFLRGSWNP